MQNLQGNFEIKQVGSDGRKHKSKRAAQRAALLSFLDVLIV